MSTEDLQESREVDDSIGSVGGRLREARIAAKLSVSEVSSQLRFGEQIIHQLEDEQFEHFAAPTFVRGYLRAYAKLLGLSEKPLLKALEQHHLHSPTLLSDIAEPPQAKSTDMPVRMATYGIFGGLLLLLALWWHSEYGINLFGSGPKTPALTASTTTAEVTPPDQKAVVPAAPAEETISALPTPSGMEKQEAPDAGDSGITAPTTIPAPETLPAPVEPVVETPPPAPLQAQLSLSFKHDSWVEVYGGDGNRIYLDLAREGETLKLKGVAPLDVLLGYAQGVSIEYNGRDFNFKPFVHQGVARFQLGGTRDSGSGAIPAATDNEATQN